MLLQSRERFIAVDGLVTVGVTIPHDELRRIAGRQISARKVERATISRSLQVGADERK